jgi:putative ABC transport system permease protein
MGSPHAYEYIANRVKAILTERHNGHEDFTVTTQAAMLESFGKVLRAITIGLGAIAAISLLVGGIGILTTMWIAVSERTSEIGLLKAIGSTSRAVQGVFLIEAATLDGIGGATGLLVGIGICELLRILAPDLPIHLPPSLAAIALLVSLATGLLSGVLPARRAAELSPLEALHAE